MKLIGITDIHGKISAVQRLVGEVKEMEDVDALILAGDITNFGNGESALRVLRPLLGLGIPVLALFGNCDGKDVPELLERLGIALHDKRREIGGVGFVGVGGSNPTPFSTIWEFPEDEILEILERNHQEGDIVVSHAPPYGTRTDLTHSGLHVGSRALRRFIEEKQPPLVLVGHIHESRAVDRVGETIVVNPGPLFRGYYSLIEVGGEISVELKRLQSL